MIQIRSFSTSHKNVIVVRKNLGTIAIIGGSMNPSSIKVFDYVGNFINDNAELALGQDRTNAGCAYLEEGPGGDPHVLIGNFFTGKINTVNVIYHFQLEVMELQVQNCGT